jgi:hypothetical protein
VKKATAVPQRWAITSQNIQELPLGFETKLNLNMISDNPYPVEFPSDITGVNEATLASDVILSRTGSVASGYAAARIHRNLIHFDRPFNTRLTEWDTRTVNLLPKAEATLNDTFPFSGPFAVGLKVGASNFWRSAGNFDDDYLITENPGDLNTPGAFEAGKDPIRQAVRLTAVPTVYTQLKPLGLFSLTPSASLYAYYYDFRGQAVPLTRGYLHLQARLSMDIQKIYDNDSKDYPKTKHLIRPTLNYSLIPYKYEDSAHPFMRQIERGNDLNYKYYFDNQDIVPYTRPPSLDNYFTPLGHSITYGLTTQLIRRQGDLPEGQVPSYEIFYELTAGQTIDFYQFSEVENERVPFSRFIATQTLSLNQLSWSSTYAYYPFVSRLVPAAINVSPSPHELNTNVKWTFYAGTRQGMYTFERSIFANYTYRNLTSIVSSLKTGFTFSVSDYVMPGASTEYEFNKRAFQSVSGFIDFQSPARCWKLRLDLTKDLVTQNQPVSFQINFALNWTGSGFASAPTL